MTPLLCDRCVLVIPFSKIGSGIGTSCFHHKLFSQFQKYVVDVSGDLHTPCQNVVFFETKYFPNSRDCNFPLAESWS